MRVGQRYNFFMKEMICLPKGADAVLIAGRANLYYFSGFPNEDAAIVLLPSGGFYITDGRYAEDAAKSVADLKVVICERGESYVARAAKILKENSIRTVGIEESCLSVKDSDELRNGTDCKFIYCSDALGKLRNVKTDLELAFMRKAQEITDAAFEKILGKIVEGMSETELLRLLENQMSELGSEEPAFKSIVAFGENTSMPHARSGARKLKRGDFVTLDFGAKYKGYCSDMTRTFVFGKPTTEMKRVYETVLEAQTMAIDAVREGTLARDVDAVCRKFFEIKNMDAFFLHSTGHGLGIEIHEKLAVSPNSSDVLVENNVFSVEPGLYFSGKFGVRIEDVVRVTKNGSYNLTKSPKHLIML